MTLSPVLEEYHHHFFFLVNFKVSTAGSQRSLGTASPHTEEEQKGTIPEHQKPF